MDLLAHARAVMATEADAITAVMNQLDERFIALVTRCREVLSRQGKLVLCGVGKSGHIAGKLAATLSSTGTPAVFMHPVEALHGDLGMLAERDLLLCLSYSGETEELLRVLPAAKRFGVPVVAITGHPESTLARLADLVLPMRVPAEACPFNLAPTASTTALLALGDALAMTLMEVNRFGREEYGRLHPAGSIGRTVTLRVADVMRQGERLPLAQPGDTVKDGLLAMTRGRCGAVVVVDPAGQLAGIFTDGDFRRRAQQSLDILQRPLAEVMTARPIFMRDEQMAVEVLTLLETREIDDIPVVDASGRVVGLVDVSDLPKFKLL